MFTMGYLSYILADMFEFSGIVRSETVVHFVCMYVLSIVTRTTDIRVEINICLCCCMFTQCITAIYACTDTFESDYIYKFLVV